MLNGKLPAPGDAEDQDLEKKSLIFKIQLAG